MICEKIGMNVAVIGVGHWGIKHVGEGKFDVILDSSHKKHIISDNALNQIIDELS